MSIYEKIHGHEPNPDHALSVPKVPYIYDYLNTKYYPAWRQHDRDYRFMRNRKESDMVMRDTIIGIDDTCPGKAFAHMAYLSVRIVGFFHYHDIL